MNRRLCCVLLMSLFAVCALMAQTAPGHWNVYNLYSDRLDRVVETPDKVYYVTAGNLYSFSPSDNETFAYNTFNKLNGTTVSRIDYNYDKGYLCIVYDDANIDLLYDDGHVVSMPDIRDAVLSYSKQILDVKLRPEGIFIATNFGFVIFDDERHLVRESAIYGSETPFADTDGELLYIINGGVLRTSPLESRHNTLNSFSQVFNVNQTSAFVTSGGNILFVHDSGERLQFIDIDRIAGKIEQSTLLDKPVSDIRVWKDGYYVVSEDYIYILGKDGKLTENIPIPQILKGEDLFFYDSPYKVYSTSGGLGCYDISDGKITVVMEPVWAENALTCRRIAFLIPSADGKRIYVSNLGSTSWNSVGTGDAFDQMQKVNLIENGTVSDLTPLGGITYDNPEFDDLKASYDASETPLFGPAGMAVEDPDDPSKFYVCNALEGVFVIKDGEQVGKINSTNAKISPTWGVKGGRTFCVAFDREGNMYVGSEYNDKGAQRFQSVIMLPASLRRSGQWTVSDWTELPLNGSFGGRKDIRMLFCRQSRMAFFIDGEYNGKLVAYDTSGSYSNIADDKHIVWETLTDQDGKEFRPEYYTCLAEDKQGRIWVGTSEGVVELTNPLRAVQPDFRINRIKVPRNDGTGLADYLLSTDKITSIAVDHSNRKWIGTEASGIYLVSANGDRILQHFTPDNSYLPSLSVYALACDPLDNTLYIGTSYGLLSYGTEASPGMESYGDIVAYPNPVRPDYSGDITIKGLMDNSLVKIADSNGNVVMQKRSEGGMVTWDGCNQSGRQVRSGVYYVFASQNSDGNSGAVTKIVIIR